jgi:hypothetical protein
MTVSQRCANVSAVASDWSSPNTRATCTTSSSFMVDTAAADILRGRPLQAIEAPTSGNSSTTNSGFRSWQCATV